MTRSQTSSRPLTRELVVGSQRSSHRRRASPPRKAKEQEPIDPVQLNDECRALALQPGPLFPVVVENFASLCAAYHHLSALDARLQAPQEEQREGEMPTHGEGGSHQHRSVCFQPSEQPRGAASSGLGSSVSASPQSEAAETAGVDVAGALPQLNSHASVYDVVTRFALAPAMFNEIASINAQLREELEERDIELHRRDQRINELQLVIEQLTGERNDDIKRRELVSRSAGPEDGVGMVRDAQTFTVALAVESLAKMDVEGN